jgi:hypothetical protein
MNDGLWLKAVRDAGGLAIAVDVGEGCALEAMRNAMYLYLGLPTLLICSVRRNALWEPYGPKVIS